MKDKIFNALKQEYARLGLGDSILTGLADMLAGMNVVTDENIESVIVGQKAYLEGLQKSNDKRVDDAVRRTIKDATEKAEAARIAHESAIALKDKELEDLRKNIQEPIVPKKEGEEIPEFFKKEMERREKQEKEWMDKFTALEKSKTEAEERIKSMEDERAKAETERANALRLEKINNKAKEKGIPDWMIKHGFADIAPDADEATIDNILNTYASEIKTSMLPSKESGMLPSGDVTKEDVEAIINMRNF